MTLLQLKLIFLFRSYSENAETSILIKLMKEKDIALKQTITLLEKTKHKDEVNLSQYSCELCFI